jgi:hypothetical protein|tara:strand:+ start:533 stop:2410 length:1878 start_codon:yes stop_codon:yes gene_type:complete
MASTYVNDLRLEEIGTGEQSGTWGATTNTNLELVAEAFSYGSEAVANASTHTITVADGATDEARSFYMKLTGGGQACTVTLAPNTLSKVWMVENATSYTLTLSQGTGANVAVLAGEVKMVATDGGGSDAVVYDLLTDVNLAGTTAINAFKLGGTAITSTAAELNYNDTGAAVGTVVASKTVTVDANKDVASFRNITLTGELDAGSLDVSGDADIDGTLEADAITIGGTAIGSVYGVVAGSSSIVTTGALNSGSITSGFGTIDTGSSTITTTGLISGGSLDIDSVLINGTTIGHTDDTDLITLADGVVTVAGEISVTTLDIGGTNVTSTAAELNILDGKAFLDEDNLASDSATGIASQQSIKAYVDASGATIADSTANTNFPVVFHNESNGLLDDTGALRYNPSTGTLLAPNLVVAGTTTTVDTVTMEAANAIIFEGATADAYETTLSIVDPTADHTQYLINQGGYIPVLAAATTTQISSTPDEINLIDGGTARGTTAVASGDGILINDAGTMRMTNVDTVSTYFASHSVGGGNIVTTGALNSGSITSGFGTIDIGSSAFTTTGTVNFGSLADGTITVTAFVDEDDMSTNSATLIPTQQSVKAYVDSSVASAATKGFAIAMAIVFG